MPGIIDALSSLLPPKAIITDPAERAAFETDWRGQYRYPSVCAVLPETTDEVAAIVRACATHGVAVVPQGGNTGLVAGGVPVADGLQIVLSLARMRRIIRVDPDDGTIIVEAGVTVQGVQAAAAAIGRMFAVSFGAEGTAQIGGAISTNAGGMQVLAHGSMRAQVMGLQVVLADGTVWDGLRALHKDNTGFDLKQLFIGGEGLLGIITAAVLRLAPAAGTRATAMVGVETVAAGIAVFHLLQAAAGPALTMCEFMTAAALRLGAAHLSGARKPFAAAAYLLVELSGTDDGVGRTLETSLAGALEAGAASDAVIAQSAAQQLDFLRLREAVPEAELAAGGAIKHDIAVPIARIAATVAAIEALAAADFADCRLNIFGHVGDGNLHVNVLPPPGQTVADLAPRKAGITLAVEALAVAHGGSFSAEHGIGQMRVPGMAAHKSAVELDLMRRIKNALDPNHVFNPGKMLP